MSVKQFENIAKEIKNYTNLVYLHVKGEPLMHPDFRNILKICEENSLMVNLTTNGTLLKNNIDILLNSKCIRQINISVHSIVENKKDIEDITLYMNDVFYCVDKLSYKYIISYRLWNVLDIKENEHNKLLLDMIGEKYMKSNLYLLAKENSSIKLKDNIYLNQDIEFKWPKIDDEELTTKGTCLGLKNQIAILVNGDVVPCCLDENANIKLGNIFEKSLEEILNSKKSISIIKGFNDNKLVERLCRTCGFRKKFESKVLSKKIFVDKRIFLEKTYNKSEKV